jgi:hypothetical protein
VIERSLFSNRAFLAGLLFLGTFFTAMSGVMLTINLFLRYGVDLTPIHTGLTMAPWALGMAVGAAASGAALGPKFGRHVLPPGHGFVSSIRTLVLVGVGCYAISFTAAFLLGGEGT